MIKYTEEEIDMLEGVCSHAGLRLLLREIDDIIAIIQKGYMSVPLDNDPQKSAMILLQERYKVEGADILRKRLVERINKIKEKP